MTTLFTKATLALALGATALTAAAPADAQRYGGRGHSDHTGTAIIAGIAGLAIGAALVAGSNSHRDRDLGYAYDDGRGYGYDDRVDYRREGYDRQGYGDYRQGYDNYGYQGQRGYAPSCYIESRWDGYARRKVAVRVCD